MQLVLPPEVVAEGLGVVVFPERDTVLLPGEVVVGRELEVVVVVGEEDGCPDVLPVVFVVVVEGVAVLM